MGNKSKVEKPQEVKKTTGKEKEPSPEIDAKASFKAGRAIPSEPKQAQTPDAGTQPLTETEAREIAQKIVDGVPRPQALDPEQDRMLRMMARRIVDGADPMDVLQGGALWMKLWEIIKPLVEEKKVFDAARHIHELAEEMIADKGITTSEGKKSFASSVNETLRVTGLSIRHPDTGEQCVLVAMPDKRGGKLALEARKDRKRSKTTRDLSKLLPFTLMPRGEE